MNAIDPKDIRAGDTVRVTHVGIGITFSWEGKVETITADRVRLNVVCGFTFDGDYTWELTDRPIGKYGPQTAEVEALIERTKSLTNAEAEALEVAWDAAWDATWDAAWDAAWAAAWDAARAAARAAARVLVVRDLIGQHGFTQEHYDLLTEPWAKVIGKVHPDDPDRRTPTMTPTPSHDDILRTVTREADAMRAQRARLLHVVNAAIDDGVSHQDLAAAAGVARQTIYNWHTETS